VPDDRKKKASGGNSGQGSFSSDQGFWQGSGRNGPNMQTANMSAKSQKDKNGTGEGTSPVKPKESRQRKPRTTGHANAGKAVVVAKGDNQRGIKRKVYKPKTPATVPPCTDLVVSCSTDVPNGPMPLVPTVWLATEDGGEDLVAESNKKHKLDACVASSRSVDLAATAEQSRPTQ
jgi:hypothetical protein